MGQRVVGPPPMPRLLVRWHDEPYADPGDCWGCGWPTASRAPVFRGLPAHPAFRPPPRPECEWCTELAAALQRAHEHHYRHLQPPTPHVPPRGPSGISPSPGGAR